jgi:hypothetical protein
MPWHATRRSKLGAIARDGLNAGSYWSDGGAMHAYYLATVQDEIDGEAGCADAPATLAVRLADLDCACLRPDKAGIEEPITTVLRMSAEDVKAEWDGSDQSWMASLDLIRSVRYAAPVPAALLSVHTGGGLALLGDMEECAGRKP